VFLYLIDLFIFIRWKNKRRILIISYGFLPLFIYDNRILFFYLHDWHPRCPTLLFQSQTQRRLHLVQHPVFILPSLCLSCLSVFKPISRRQRVWGAQEGHFLLFCLVCFVHPLHLGFEGGFLLLEDVFMRGFNGIENWRTAIRK
jgi:hypothetical protein